MEGQDWIDFLTKADISGRALTILKRYTTSEQGFLNMDKKKLKTLRNAGPQTVVELLEFQSLLRSSS